MVLSKALNKFKLFQNIFSFALSPPHHCPALKHMPMRKDIENRHLLRLREVGGIVPKLREIKWLVLLIWLGQISARINMLVCWDSKSWLITPCTSVPMYYAIHKIMVTNMISDCMHCFQFLKASPNDTLFPLQPFFQISSISMALNSIYI